MSGRKQGFPSLQQKKRPHADEGFACSKLSGFTGERRPESWGLVEKLFLNPDVPGLRGFFVLRAEGIPPLCSLVLLQCLQNKSQKRRPDSPAFSPSPAFHFPPVGL